MSRARSRFFDRTLPDHGWIDQIPADGSEAEWRRCRILAGQVEVGAAVERENFSYFQLGESAQRAGDRGRFIAFGIRLCTK